MIGLIGFGRFGRLAAKYLAQDYPVHIFTPSGKFAEIAAMGANPVSIVEAASQDIVIISVPISEFKSTLQYIKPFLKRGAVVVDVCSVKEYAVTCMRKILPKHIQILATHPMFGPDSAARSVRGAKIVMWPERINADIYRQIKVYLLGKGLMVSEVDPSRHDQQMALSLSLTHFIGRGLEEFGARPLEVDTEGYKRLLGIMGFVVNDSWQLFMDMQHYNRYAPKVRADFMEALLKVESKIAEIE